MSSARAPDPNFSLYPEMSRSKSSIDSEMDRETGRMTRLRPLESIANNDKKVLCEARHLENNSILSLLDLLPRWFPTRLDSFGNWSGNIGNFTRIRRKMRPTKIWMTRFHPLGRDTYDSRRIIYSKWTGHEWMWRGAPLWQNWCWIVTRLLNYEYTFILI